MREDDVFFDNIEIRDMNVYLLEGHEHPLLAATRDRTDTIPGVAGAFDYGADLDPIPFNLPLGTRQSSRAEVQRTARNFKYLLLDNQGKPKTFKLKFGYAADRYYNVRYSGQLPIDRLVRMGSFTLPLICYEGHAHSVVKNNEVTWGSKVIPFASEYKFGHKGGGAKAFTASGSTNITVTGHNLRPILHVSGSGTNVKISWGGKTMELGTFTNTTWVIGLNEFEVTKNGKNAINEIKGDWLDMELQRGENKINVSGSGLNLNLRFEFRDRYF